MTSYSKPFWEEINEDQIKNDDIIYINYIGKGSYDHYKIINGKWFNIFEDKFHDYFKPDKKYRYEIYRQNYKFISKKEEWFFEGTEAYLESDPYGNEKSGYSAVFRGWVKDEKTGKLGEDGELCPFDEFDITEL